MTGVGVAVGGQQCPPGGFWTFSERSRAVWTVAVAHSKKTKNETSNWGEVPRMIIAIRELML